MFFVLSSLKNRFKKKKNVVVDDENTKVHTREAFLVAVRASVPHCRLRAINFFPQGGLQQCLWAREFAVAERGQVSGLASVEEIRQWFLASKEMARKTEGYIQVSVAKPTLYINGKLDNSALIIDASSLIEFRRRPGRQHSSDSYEVALVCEDARQTLHEWKQATPNGQLVVLCCESHLFPSSLQMYAEEPITYTGLIEVYRQQMLAALEALGPIHVVALEYGAEGQEWNLIAMSQRLHGWSVSNAVFVVPQGGGVSPFEQVCHAFGLRTLNPGRLFESRSENGWSGAVRVARYSTKLPEPTDGSHFLRDIWCCDLVSMQKEVSLEASFAGRYWKILGRRQEQEEEEEPQAVAEENQSSQQQRRARTLPDWMLQGAVGESVDDEDDNNAVQKRVKRENEIN